jgi:hypothetical protein
MTLLRTESFVPLTAAPVAPGQREFHVGIIPRDEHFRPFKSLEKKPLAPGETALSGGKQFCEPRISVQRDGDRVTSIRIQCTCGQVMELACVYDEPPKAE